MLIVMTTQPQSTAEPAMFYSWLTGADGLNHAVLELVLASAVARGDQGGVRVRLRGRP
jgi:hypothetical protein